MRLISDMDGLQFVLTTELWHQMPRGRPPQRKSEAYSANSSAVSGMAEGAALFCPTLVLSMPCNLAVSREAPQRLGSYWIAFERVSREVGTSGIWMFNI